MIPYFEKVDILGNISLEYCLLKQLGIIYMNEK